MIRDENAFICAVVDSWSDWTGNEKIVCMAIGIMASGVVFSLRGVSQSPITFKFSSSINCPYDYVTTKRWNRKKLLEKFESSTLGPYRLTRIKSWFIGELCLIMNLPVESRIVFWIQRGRDLWTSTATPLACDEEEHAVTWPGRLFLSQVVSLESKCVSCIKTILGWYCLNLFITCFSLTNFLRPLTFQEISSSS